MNLILFFILISIVTISLILFYFRKYIMAALQVVIPFALIFGMLFAIIVTGFFMVITGQLGEFEPSEFMEPVNVDDIRVNQPVQSSIVTEEFRVNFEDRPGYVVVTYDSKYYNTIDIQPTDSGKFDIYIESKGNLLNIPSEPSFGFIDMTGAEYIVQEEDIHIHDGPPPESWTEDVFDTSILDDNLN